MADPDTSVSLRPTGPFLHVDSGPLQARIYQNSGHIELAGPDLGGAAHAVTVTIAPAASVVAGQLRRLGRIASSTAIPNGLECVQALDGSMARTRLAFVQPDIMRFEVTDWGGETPSTTSLVGASPGSERFYGFGEKFDALDQSGRTVNMLTFDHPGTKGDHSYKPVPWFISTRGYGLHLDSTAESSFAMRTIAQDRFIVTHHDGSLPVHLVYGPHLPDVLSRFTGLVGRPPLPPPFAFGVWISSDVWRSGGELRYAVSKFRERMLPASAVVFDSPWETAYNDFTFNMTQFGQGGTFEGKHFDGFTSLSEMMHFLQQNGLKAICWLTPIVNTTSQHNEVAGQLAVAPNHADGVAKGAFVRAGPGGPPLRVNWWKGEGNSVDFTTATGRDWLTAQVRTLLSASAVTTRSGRSQPAIGGFKTDDGEAATDGGKNYIPETAQYADGHTGRRMRNGYCVAYHQALWNVLKSDGVLFARSGFSGTQKFPGCWAGDNEPNFGQENGLPSVIIAGLSAAMSGFSIWGHDIGGYQNSNFSASPQDLFIRWTQFGCFSPIMQMHRQVDPHTLRQYPWGYPIAGETVEENAALANFRFYARLHLQLFPYICSLARISSETGMPILRPLVLMHQDDPNTFGVQHAYYFGSDMLVAPIVDRDATSRDVYLPKGNWNDFWTGDQHAGGQLFRWSNADHSRLPVFIRTGSVIPMLVDNAETLCDADYVNNPASRTAGTGLLLLVHPGPRSRFLMYDGTELLQENAGATRTVSLTSSARTFRLQIRLAAPPTAVALDSNALSQTSLSDLDKGAAGWSYDGRERLLHIGFHHNGGLGTITY
jgi:alpha-D-xyloside xylohydrolase